jgi:selenocysteine lyase/cysteine desulfurase
MTTTAALPLPDAAALFAGRRGYLNTSTCGLPPAPALDAFRRVLDEWRDGRGGPAEWGEAVEECRRLFAQLVRVPVAHVAVGSQVSALVGVVAASLPAGTSVLLAEGDFTSLLWPFLVQRERGLRVRVVPLDGLVDAVDDGTDWVAVSAVQSSSGRLLDLDALRAAARAHGARVLLDVAHAAGWLPLDAGEYDIVVAPGYKWLLGPRGTCFAAVRPDVLPGLVPLAAGWYAGEDVHTSYYGQPLRLAPDARRLDVSPAWFSWGAAAPGLRLLRDVGVERIRAHDLGLADAFRARVGLEPAGSPIVSLPADDAVLRRLAAAGVTTAGRAGRLRLAFHLYNDEEDVERAAACWTGG